MNRVPLSSHTERRMTQCTAALLLCLNSVYSFCPRPLFTVQWGLKSLGSEGGRMLHTCPRGQQLYPYVHDRSRENGEVSGESLSYPSEVVLPDRTAPRVCCWYGMPWGTVAGCCEVLLLLFWIFFISVIFLLQVTYIILFQSCAKYKKEVGTGSKWRNKGGKQSAEGLKERDRKQSLEKARLKSGVWGMPSGWFCFYMYANTQFQAHILFSFCLFLGLIRYKYKEPKSETKLWILQTKSFHWLKMLWQWPWKSIKIKDSIQVLNKMSLPKAKNVLGNVICTEVCRL